jgi:DNA-3-methyladenine glycosylase II
VTEPGPYGRLVQGDPVLGRLTEVYGRPDPFLWEDGGRTGDDNFAALLLHIAGQQISTAVAFVLFDRIAAAVGRLPDAPGVVELGPDRLRACGLSRAKAAYMLGLAEMQIAGTIDVYGLEGMSDEAAIAALTSVKGLGLWTSEMFLLHQLRRGDVLPAGDVGIRRAIEPAWGLDAVPTIKEARLRAEAWAPYRSYASALLWASLGPAPERALPPRS